MPPVISIVGKSRSAKTTVIERLVRELKSRGYQVATIKHAPSGTTFDEPGKNGWRHAEAGSNATVFSSPDSVVLVKPVSQDTPLQDIVHLLGEEYDVILTEGFKEEGTPKLEVHHKGNRAPLKNIRKRIAVVTDEPLETKARQFSFGDTKGLVDLLERGFIRPQAKRICLYVNNAPVLLTSFPRQIITNIIMAIASCLKGVREINSLQIFLRQ